MHHASEPYRLRCMVASPMMSCMRWRLSMASASSWVLARKVWPQVLHTIFAMGLISVKMFDLGPING